MTAWTGEAKMAGRDIALWDPVSDDLAPEDLQKSKLRSEELSNLLAKSRVKIARISAPPADVPYVQLQKLNDLDAVVLAGAFSNAEINVLDVALQRVIDLESDDPKVPKEWVRSVYTGVVPIVYKAQRACSRA